MKRIKSDAHLAMIRTLPCIICQDDTATEAAHIRFADRRAGKRQTGMGEKPNDIFTIPLCGRHHREQHSMDERAFWSKHGIDPIFVALALNGAGDRMIAEQIVAFHACTHS